jgi:DNA primase
MKNDDVLAWLRLERGITLETVERFKLGWLERNHFFPKEEFALPADGKKLVVPAGLVIPWQDKRIRVRRKNDADAEKYGKYYMVPGSDSEPRIIGTPYETPAVIVESELDAILLAQEIKRPLFIVALGSVAIKPSPELLERLALCPVVLVALDNDEAGGKASQWWLENVPGCHRTLTPSRYGKDFGEAFKNGLDLEQWLGVAMMIFASELAKETTGKTSGEHFTENLF